MAADPAFTSTPCRIQTKPRNDQDRAECRASNLAEVSNPCTTIRSVPGPARSHHPSIPAPSAARTLGVISLTATWATVASCWRCPFVVEGLRHQATLTPSGPSRFVGQASGQLAASRKWRTVGTLSNSWSRAVRFWTRSSVRADDVRPVSSMVLSAAAAASSMFLASRWASARVLV